ncbi:uroporphyrinogen-III synthase [Raoultella terrigena]|uniref:Uroporphyrinogen-III synthase n=1 Tax=Raoultella terrigena TaxID=577 RepID=A0A3P8JUF5_RAOTE|nr:uroporphyrinogen-III synthase [Raoultella terrigena]
MSILVTRPLPQGEELVSRLRGLGRVAWSFPLIEFTPGRELHTLGDRLAALSAGDLLFALSQHAVEFAHARLQQQALRWPPAPGYFAIGRTTALTLHKVSSQNIRYPLDREISEVLLQLPELQNIAGRRPSCFAATAAGNYSAKRSASAALMSLFVSAINVVQSIMMVQKKQCAGSLAASPRWSSPAVRCCSSFGR